MATPSNNRHKDVFRGLPRFPRQCIASLPELEEVSPSSISCVPSTSRKAQRSPLSALDSTRKTGSSAWPVAETPTRDPIKLWGRPSISFAAMESVTDKSRPSPLSAAAKLPQTPNELFTSTHRPLQVHETPSKVRYSYQVEQSEDSTIRATPVQAPSVASKPWENSSKAVSSPVSHEKEVSIYAALGWDDVVDEFLWIWVSFLHPATMFIVRQ